MFLPYSVPIWQPAKRPWQSGATLAVRSGKRSPGDINSSGLPDRQCRSPNKIVATSAQGVVDLAAVRAAGGKTRMESQGPTQRVDLGNDVVILSAGNTK